MDQLITFAMSQSLLSTIWLFIVLMIIVMTIRIQMSPIKQLSTQQMTFLVNRESGVVVDSRSEKDFKAGHIVDALHLGNDKVSKNDFSSLEKHKDNPIIIVCSAGMSAGKVANQLAKAGFTRVSLLKGGMSAWLSAGLPVTK
ncbi:MULTISPECIES: rhodanese-like domain-containing protein [unclassified Colwellia]|jgi:rhodanese-related sulfurtransferase|uniref:rhodanese-like domain-containing protein n=1 Tax=unclassified Colwellia TaxID=196834 RepID=UPI0015F6D67F|nr:MULTISPECIES: rhodanese-like domain-containing protein [unclassified Colwellia]MBA6225849.1 rhodanese-like domain-containing protein [Colwellia sp. MB3u-45]MBA6267085.1 rhodanese-like domain-containing protein [Colwellia sp. MB3u-43]MBA6290407.1 rhodanese-like domain-containing protein [Colwellia sp. MB3u-4]MBA6295172.1 rhodanese-like domain-containing protein [Colwellia sp. MB02u-9]MBA6322009.1 rhodanese-like domain-containing protein [Colwellia sp. MB02u-19]